MNTSEPGLGSLSVSDFDTFFAEVRDGAHPFAWQRRLLDHVTESGRWPEVISAPTGSGKTTVIDVHVFANALHAAGGIRVPRRMAMVVNRRALVDDHRDQADALQEALESAPPDSVAGRVRRLLRQLGARGPLTEVEEQYGGFVTATLRGGSRQRSWRDDPTTCAVLCATPDMWGSRLLFRGYGSSPGARPVEAELLARDSVLVTDEAHLNRQLILTARRVSDFIGCDPGIGEVPGLQVVETTATPVGSGPSVGLRPTDLDHDPVLASRMRATKSVSLLELETGPRPDRATVDGYVEACWCLRDELDGGTVGCLVNTVALATAVATGLEARAARERKEIVVECLVGPMRPFDVAELRRRRPGLLTLAGDEQVQFLVATQTLEVGIDLDLRALVSSLAPASALAQRFGRVNRIGRRTDRAPVVVVVPAGPVVAPDGPYVLDDLAAARAWLDELVDQGGGDISPLRLSNLPAPQERPRRVLFQRPELADVDWWSRTSGDLMTEPGEDVSLWLRDDLSVLPEVGIVVRRGLPVAIDQAIALLDATPPEAAEIYPSTLGVVASLVTRGADDRANDSEPLLVVKADGEVVPAVEAGVATRIGPGDILVVPTDVAFLDHAVVQRDGVECGTDVYEPACAEHHAFRFLLPGTTDRKGGVRGGPQPSLRIALRTLCAGPRQTREDRAGLADVLESTPTDGNVEEGVRRSAQLLREPLYRTEAIVVGDPMDAVGDLILVVRGTGADVGPQATQVWSTSEVVALEAHQRDVAALAESQAERLGLDANLAELLRLAGLYHDGGKADPRFQRALGALDEDAGPLRAKSGGVSPRERRRALSGCGLPSGWRHEQLSAALVRTAGAEPPKELLVRLVGTTHGHGRSSFRHGSHVLLGPSTVSERAGDPTAGRGAERERAVALFGEGGWERLVENTDLQYGAWTVAFLEAIVRTADTRISAAGR